MASAVVGSMLTVACGPQSASDKHENPNAAESTATIVTSDESTVPAVDLGLSVKWAPMNVGASAPEEFGNYYAWGETKAYGEEDPTNGQNYRSSDSTSYRKDFYDWTTYKFCEGSRMSLTKYCVNTSEGVVDNKTMLDLSDDAAHATMGGRWRIPTDDELAELREKCTWTWGEANGVAGYTVTGPNGNSIFLPAAGCRSNQSHGLVADKGPIHVGGGGYWSSSLERDKSSSLAWRLNFGEKVVSWSYESRCEGATIRAVCAE